MTKQPPKKKTIKSKSASDTVPIEKSLINDTIANIDQRYGKGTVICMGSTNIAAKKVDVIPTGSVSLDIALGYGGLPRGRIVELWGKEGCIHKDTIIHCDLRNGSNQYKLTKLPIHELYERHKNKEQFLIFSMDDLGNKISNRIVDVINCGEKECVRIRTVGNRELTCTMDHKVRIVDGPFKPACNLKPKDRLYVNKGISRDTKTREDSVASVHIHGTVPTFDIRCFSPYNNYLANDICVHNSGKTTLSLHTVANAQKLGGTCVFIDAEHALDMAYAKRIGVIEDKLLLCQPDYGEQGLDVASMFIKDKSVSCIVVDSVAALTPKAEIEGDIGDIHVGLQARMMSQAMRKLTSDVSRYGTLLVFINQIRDRIGTMYGSTSNTTGGNALKFYASVRLEIARIGAYRKGGGTTGDIIGNRTKVKVVKNKLAPPFRTTEFDLIYGEGISYTGDVIDLSLQKGILTRQGAFYSYNNEVIGQGREKAKLFLEENPKILAELDKKLRGNLP